MSGLSSVEKTEEDRKGAERFDWSVVSLAWRLGYTIAVPLVVFALLGRFADQALETTPWMMLMGILVATIVTSILLYRKIKKTLSRLK